MLNFKNLFRRKHIEQHPQNLPEPTPERHVLSSSLGIPPGIYTIVYEMDLFRDNMFLGTYCQLALYEYQGNAIAAPVDFRRDEDLKAWYLRRVREAVYFGKPLSKLTSADVHAAFFPNDQAEMQEEKELLGTLFERRPALYYESSLENVLADTYCREKNYFRIEQ